ncbi:MAG TPA: toprim domain-containing protein [Patescibacteria group bacterium]|nr:toprim domain-containing protein [Patescibacteria group bacterium]
MGEQVKVDFKRLKCVPLDSVLQRYGVQTRNSTNNQLVANCPLPTHTSKDKGSFKVNSVKNVWCCMSESCVKASGKKGGDALDFVSLMEKCSILDAAKKMLEWFPETGQPKIETALQKPTASEKEQARAKNAPPVNKPLGFTLQGISYHPYLESRGISEETAKHFGVGFFPGKGSMAGRIVIPIHNEHGELVAYAGRSIDGSEPKYKLPLGFQKSLVLHNLHRVGEMAHSVIVVEGFFGAMWVYQCGYANVVALMGHSISDEQLKLLTFRRIILMLDSWEDGADVRQKTILRIASQSFVHSVELPKGKQPDGLTQEELKTILGPLI